MDSRDIAFIEAVKESRKRRLKYKTIRFKNEKINIFKQIINKINYKFKE